MPELPTSRWRRREPDVLLLDAIMAGQALPADAPRQIRVLADWLTQLAKPNGPGELAGEAAAMSAFRRRISPATTMPLARARSHRLRRPRLMAGRARLAAAFATAAVAVGGSAAAYAGVLPGPVQNLAHRLIDAPPAFDNAAHPAAGNQPPGLHHGGGASRGSTTSRKHQQVSHGIAKSHGKRTRRPHWADKGKASQHRPRKPAHRHRRHAPKISPSPTPTPTPIR
jgi:hypothetical protein